MFKAIRTFIITIFSGATYYAKAFETSGRVTNTAAEQWEEKMNIAHTKLIDAE